MGSGASAAAGAISGKSGGSIGGFGEMLFGDGGAGAAGSAAMAQQAFAERQLADTDTRVTQSLTRSYAEGDRLNQFTVAGLTSLDKDISNQERNLARQEQLISQIDPTIIEASQQALKLLRGEQSSALNPLKNQRDQQRQRLLNSLREQLGPGAETSTAGIQALTKFDSETDSLFAGAQQQALSNLGGVSSQFSAQRPDMFREIMGRSQFGQNQYQLGANQAQFGMGLAQMGFQGAQLMNQAAAPAFQSQGSQFTTDTLRGQNAKAFGESLFKAGTSAAIGGMGGAAKPPVA